MGKKIGDLIILPSLITDDQRQLFDVPNRYYTPYNITRILEACQNPQVLDPTNWDFQTVADGLVSRVSTSVVLVHKKLEPKHIFTLLCSWAACYCLLSRFSMLPNSITLTPALPRGVMGVVLGCLAEFNGPETRAILQGYQEGYLDKSGMLNQLQGRAVQMASAPLHLTGKIRDCVACML